jgi:formate hydrogenlyase transcriptional activator
MDQSNQRVKLLGELSLRINAGESFDAVFDVLYGALRRHVPCDRLALVFLHADGNAVVVGPVRSERRIFLHTGFRESLLAAGFEQILSSHSAALIGDLSQYAGQHPQSEMLRLLLQESMRSCLIVPLAADNRDIGALWFCSRKPNAFTREHDSFMRLIAAQLATMLEKARLASKVAVHDQVKSRLLQENSRLRELASTPAVLRELIGSSAAWRKTLQRMELVAATDASVLIRGETGTGKELIARAIHHLSSRGEKPFVAINCGALSPQLIASELFGHERGAFTGAVARKFGRLDLAFGGTLFLDEVAELPADMQVKLLRVLQEREYERVGGTATIKSDVRIIAATHRNLEAERAEKRFRDDLFFRLNVFPIAVPPLRERKEDIEPLLEFFLKRYAQKMGKYFVRIDPQALQQCLYYHWPGNIRELENLVERSVILSRGPVFYIDPLLESESLSAPSADPSLAGAIRAHLIKTLRVTNSRIYGPRGAAKLLQIKPSTLQAKLKKLGIDHRNLPHD